MVIVIVGAGWCGLGLALLLTRDGHEVTVVEKDASAPVPAAWDDWERPGVAQFRQPHLMLPGGHRLLEAELPEVNAGLRAAGAAEFSIIAGLANLLPDVDLRDPEGRYVTLNARRPVLEHVVASIAQGRTDIRRATAAVGLTAGASDRGRVPRVDGVRLSSGETLAADLVVDMTGRRSPLPDWLADLGCRPPAEQAGSGGFTYYTQFLRSPDGTVPTARGPLNTPIGTISVLTLPADHGSWSVTVYIPSHDQELKEIRRPDAFRRVIGACPLHAHWLEGEAVGGIRAMSGAVDRHRSFVRDGEPVVTGVLAVGDSWASTNPSLGRGMTLGLLQLCRLRDLLRTDPDPAKLALQWAAVTAAELDPWYRSCVAADRERLAETEALRAGRPTPVPVEAAARLRLAGVRARDADLIRAAFDVISVHERPEDVLARPDVQERLAAGDLSRGTGAGMPGPDRQQLLELVHGG